jgi:hypothetical protein
LTPTYALLLEGRLHAQHVARDACVNRRKQRLQRRRTLPHLRAALRVARVVVVKEAQSTA